MNREIELGLAKHHLTLLRHRLQMPNRNKCSTICFTEVFVDLGELTIRVVYHFIYEGLECVQSITTILHHVKQISEVLSSIVGKLLDRFG